MKLLFYILLLTVKFLPAQVTDSAIRDTGVNRILILTAFDGIITRHVNVTYNDNSKRAIKEKEFFEMLADSLIQIFSDRLKTNYHKEPLPVHDSIETNRNTDSSIYFLMKVKNAGSAIVIRELNLYFEQTRVEVEKSSDGSKSRTAFFDICSFARYSFFSAGDEIGKSEIKKCEFFNDRAVISGLFAFGPDILKKRKDAFRQISKTADLYLIEIENKLK